MVAAARETRRLNIAFAVNPDRNIRKLLKWRCGNPAERLSASEGRSKKEAEQDAAQAALKILEAREAESLKKFMPSETTAPQREVLSDGISQLTIVMHAFTDRLREAGSLSMPSHCSSPSCWHSSSLPSLFRLSRYRRNPWNRRCWSVIIYW